MPRLMPHKVFFGAVLAIVLVACAAAFAGDAPALLILLAGVAGAGIDPISIALSMSAGVLGKRWYLGVPIAAGIAVVIGLLLGQGAGTVFTIAAMVFWAFVGDFVGEIWWRRDPEQAQAEE